MECISNVDVSPGIQETLFAMQQKNLVYNGTFKYFSNQEEVNHSIIFHHPDGWFFTNPGSDGQIAQYNDHCRIVVNSEGNRMCLKQSLHEFPRWQKDLRGETLTVEAVFLLHADTQIEMSLSDGDNRVSHKATISKNDTYVFHLQLEISDQALGVFFEIQSETPEAVIEVMSVYGNLGTVAIATLPLMVNGVIGERKQYIATESAPAEELMLCYQTPYELQLYQSRLDSVLNGRFGRGKNGRSLLPDVRGYFSRVWDNGATVDPNAEERTAFPHATIHGDRVSTLQEDVFAEHQHALNFSLSEPNTIGQGLPAKGVLTRPTSKTGVQGGKETRPKNFSELYTITWA